MNLLDKFQKGKAEFFNNKEHAYQDTIDFTNIFLGSVLTGIEGIEGGEKAVKEALKIAKNVMERYYEKAKGDI